MRRIGIDVGGTNTDAVLLDGAINAVVQRRYLSKVAAVRVGMPASASLPPFSASATSCSRRLLRKRSAATTSPAACSSIREAKAASISLSVLALRIGSCTPFARVACCTSPMSCSAICTVLVHEQGDYSGLGNQL